MLTCSAKSEHPLWGSSHRTKTVGTHYSFGVNHVWAGMSSVLDFFFLAGKPEIALNGEACYKDFIVIPNPTQTPTVKTDRFCGNALVKTTCKYPELFI